MPNRSGSATDGGIRARDAYMRGVMEADTMPVAKGRPREFCVDTALAMALRVFWSRGYEGASISDLTSAMGITRPSMYAAFGNKEALFRKAFDLYEQEKLAYMRRAMDAPTAKGVVERLMRGGIDLQTSDCETRGCLGVISSVACSEQAQSIRDEVIARRASSRQALLDRFEHARAARDFGPEIDVEGLVNYLFALLQGLALLAGSGATRDELERAVAMALKVWPTR